MSRLWLMVVLVGAITGQTWADLYMQQPRGGNNRLNEKTATRTNNNRMFDSQNNNRGGYNVGDTGVTAASNEQGQYRMKYFQSGNVGESDLRVEWTQQHGGGADETTLPLKLNSNMVLQVMCQPNTQPITADDSITLRNGRSTTTQAYNAASAANAATAAAKESRRQADVREDRGIHESWEWYDACATRDRNKNLFTADQNLANDDARSTRQNPNGGRSGYECPEERDYYPYWHPTPWMDVAVIAHNASFCQYYQDNSFNRQPYGECVKQFETGGGRNHASSPNNPADCAQQGGTWTEYHNYLELAPEFTNQAACEANNNQADMSVEYMWGKPYDMVKIIAHDNIDDACFVRAPKLDCQPGDWSRVNDLGNGREGKQLSYTWRIPHFPSNDEQRCVFRMRYNISTDDYDPFNTNANKNGDNSPIQNNQQFETGLQGKELQLAINTAQLGRTFQDRGHVFLLRSRVTAAISDDAHVVNLNVRGKRGNIVQTFPATEYDFTPKRMELTVNDLVHVQWTGSNTHDNNAPGGDGQTGDDGEGTDGTDRNNFLEMPNADGNFPTPIESTKLFKSMDVVWNSAGTTTIGTTADEQAKNTAIQLASSGYYKCAKAADCGADSVETKTAINNKLNNAAASYEGLVFKMKEAGDYHYMCTRNNNFSNRSQKGQITVRRPAVAADQL